jgi:membrane-bound lytic murein transglycosylase B
MDKRYYLILGAIVTFLMPQSAHGAIADDIAAKQQQIEALQRQIDAYQAQAEAAGQQSKTLQSEVARLNAQIGSLTTQIKSLSLSIDSTNLGIQETSSAISDGEHRLELHRQAMAQYLRETDAVDQMSLSQILLQHNALSDFFDYIHSIQRTQDNLRLAIRSITDLQETLDRRRDDLEAKRTDLERLKGLQELQKKDLAGTKGTKDQLLKTTKGQEVKFQQLVQKTQQDLVRLREQISFLLQGGISVEDAVKYAQLAAIGAGIRPAFLLALLETESRLGKNVGTGNWRDDMYLCYLRLADIAKTADRKAFYRNRAETEKNAFMAVTGKLGLDPDSVKVSREPSYGCGGAMGPAQFIPSTWLGYEGEVIRLTGHNPVSPWNFQDAFTASAIKLARGGATSKDRAGETRAAKAYISGNGSCTTTTCNSYASTILRKAAEIEQDL